MMMGGMYGIIQMLILAVYVTLIGLCIYGLILLIKALRRGITALDYYNAEKKAMQAMESVASGRDEESLEENEYESTEEVEANDETTENTEQENSEK